MRYIKRNANGIIEAASEIKFDETYEYATEEYDVGFDGKIYSYTEMQGTDYLTRKSVHDTEMKLAKIRLRRERECFSVINRGALWYEKLTEEQRAELSTWYQAWLDAPQTGVIPEKPTRIDEM